MTLDRSSLFLAALIAGCGGGGSEAASPASPAAPPPASAPAPSNRWALVWSDEFDTPAGTRPNPAHWNHDLGNKEADGWGNRELQYYTADARNAQTDGSGLLLITADKASAPGPCWNAPQCGYTSARIHTRGKVAFTYGKAEARLKVPAGIGLWPAFWTLGQAGDWPAGGELDIMEYVGKAPRETYGTAHGPGYSGGQSLGKSFAFSAPVADGFHTFTLIKRPFEVIWLVDGVEYHRLTPTQLPAGAPWPFEQPFFLIFNLAVGGDWPGPPDASTPFPARLAVDWVRVYKED